MGTLPRLVRLLRHLTDPIAPLSFNRQGFALNRVGFEEDDARGDGRIALVTGANSGIGLATSRELARRGFDVWMLCRDRERGRAARDAVLAAHGERVHLAVVDVSRLASIRRFARELPLDRVDVLVHNAGVLPDRRTITEDGVELTFATHVLGPFAMTALLLGRLSRSTDARVVFVASGGLYPQRLDLDLLEVDEASFDGVRAYANAKRAQVILARLLAERLAGEAPITFASMHPGWVDTPALRSSLPRFYGLMAPLLRTPEQGADTVVWLASSPEVKGSQGELWFDRRVAMQYPLPWTRETAAARVGLLSTCEQLCGIELAR